MSDLFISYSSHDRPWAERLYEDMVAKFPSISIFLDVRSIPAGAEWRPILEREKREARYFASFWSEKARASNEVGPELEAFLANHHTNEHVFYIPLEGSRGPQEENQGFPAFKPLYKAADEVKDRGVSGINVDPYRAEWNRLTRMIGDAIEKSRTTQPVKLAVLCMSTDISDLLDQVLTLRTGPGPTLKEFLDGISLNLTDIKPRYAATALGWRPFGTKETIWDFMEDLRVDANSKLKDEYRFHWDTKDADLVAVARSAQNEQELQAKLDALTSGPSVVLLDPVSLYNPVVSYIFPRLDDYSKREQSVIVSLCPVQEKTADLIYQSLRSRGAPLLNGYFLPQIPPAGAFARCGVNLQHKMDVERLLRISLGSFQLQKKEAANKAVFSLGG